MLTVTAKQMNALSKHQFADFELRLADHLTKQYPEILKFHDIPSLARGCIKLAMGRGLKSELAICLYSHLVLTFGRNFESRPDIEWTESIAVQPAETLDSWISRVTSIAVKTLEERAGARP